MTTSHDFDEAVREYGLEPESVRDLIKSLLAESSEQTDPEEAMMLFAEMCFFAGLQHGVSVSGGDETTIEATIASPEFGVALVHAIMNGLPIDIRLSMP